MSPRVRRVLISLPALGFAVFLVIISIAGFGFRNEQALIDHCSRNSQTMPYDAPIIGGLGCPHLVGYVQWSGPRFLEQPMREMGIPWFERIVKVVIVRSDYVKLNDLSPLRKLAHLKEVEVLDDTNPERNYEDFRSEFPATKLTIWGR